MKLDGRLLHVADLTDCERDEMYSLMELYYEPMDRAVFEADLVEKQWVILLQDSTDGRIRGFSTQMILDVTVDGQQARALFSGDTIVDREHWSQNPLAQIWGRLALSLIDENRSTQLFWFLITKGYKTYRFLPVFFHEFYPRYDRETPAGIARVIDAMGRNKFSTFYDREAAIVRADHGGCRLRHNIAEITGRRLQDPHVQFFAETNPGHVRGDELCCLAPLTRENFTPAAYRVIGTPTQSEVLP